MCGIEFTSNNIGADNDRRELAHVRRELNDLYTAWERTCRDGETHSVKICLGEVTFSRNFLWQIVMEVKK